MEQNQTKYTVFLDPECWQDSCPECGCSLSEIIEWCAKEGYTPIAWCEGSASGRVNALRSESIAAGRLIEKVGYKYVARGMEEAKTSVMDQLREEMFRLVRETLPVPTARNTIQNTAEPKRAPLDWNKSTPFDPFKGFSVTSGTSSTTHTHSHPLQKMAEGKDGFGSAALLKG